MSDPLADYPVHVELPVCWGEMDAYGHVNNIVYFRYFENARLEYFRQLDWFDLGRASGVGPILAATEARFRKPLTYPDTIRVACRVADIQADRFTIEHLVFSSRLNAVAAEGKGLIVIFDYDKGCKAELPEELRRRIEEMERRRQQ